MVRLSKDGRNLAEERFQRARKIDAEARKVIDSELAATRKKTAGLKAQRLAKEAAEGTTAFDKKETPPTRRAKT